MNRSDLLLFLTLRPNPSLRRAHRVTNEMTIFYRAVDAGPLTTTFTPPPDCTGTNIDGPPYYVFTNLGPVSCEPPDNFNSCRPGTTRSRLETEDGYTYQPLPTYSPGLICPAHWTTATTITGTTRDPEAYSSREEDIFRNVFSLKETDTLVLCCPRYVSAHPDGVDFARKSSVLHITNQWLSLCSPPFTAA